MEINNVMVENVDELERILNDKLKAEWYDFDEYVKDIVNTVHEKGLEEGTYELMSHETKSGNPSDIHYKYEFEYDEDLDETKNEVITIL